ncbi:MAG: SDR family NAD(P)-dependent oxidoreductase [Candidatus Obscuribacterales bacterium]|nr:SDR family NAD(P)-dependent oxidoreductase [Candidatus Obscuribacterales bacterium]
MSNSQKSVAIVTGASSGIGLGLVQALLARDYAVIATSRTATKSKNLAASPNLVLVDGDIGKKTTAVAVANAAMKHFGRIDLLVNNAGMFMSKLFTDYTEEDFALMVSTNVASFFYMSQQVIPAMQRQKSGHIVNISTTLVDQPVLGVPASLPVLTKSTMSAVSRELAIEYAAQGIRINTVSPGTVNTPMHASEDHETLKKLHPIQRLAEISDIVDAVLYLTSASFVTGENLRVDGGAHAGRW